MTEAVISTIAPNSRMASNEVKIQETPTGQLIATIPRSLAQAHGLKKGDTIEWLFKDGELLVKKKVKS